MAGWRDRLSDDELVRRARGGDSDSFSVLWERHCRRCQSLISGWVSPYADVQDTLSSLHLRLWHNLHRYELGTNFRCWITTCAVNEAKTVAKLSQRLPTPVSSLTGPLYGREPQVDPHSDDMLIASELAQAVRRQVAHLSSTQREVVVMVAHGLGYREIAAATGVPVGTVKSRHHYAREALARGLDAEGV